MLPKFIIKIGKFMHGATVKSTRKLLDWRMENLTALRRFDEKEAKSTDALASLVAMSGEYNPKS